MLSIRGRLLFWKFDLFYWSGCKIIKPFSQRPPTSYSTSYL